MEGLHIPHEADETSVSFPGGWMLEQQLPPGPESAGGGSTEITSPYLAENDPYAEASVHDNQKPEVNPELPIVEAEAPVRTSILPDAPPTPPSHRYMRDLYGVGPTKPLGYLPRSTIAECGEDISVVTALLRQRGLTVIEKSGFTTSVGSGALVAYDREALAAFLEKHVDVLRRERWPVEPDAFVRRVTGRRFAKGEAYDIVARAFDDPRPEYRD